MRRPARCGVVGVGGRRCDRVHVTAAGGDVTVDRGHDPSDAASAGVAGPAEHRVHRRPVRFVQFEEVGDVVGTIVGQAQSAQRRRHPAAQGPTCCERAPAAASPIARRRCPVSGSTAGEVVRRRSVGSFDIPEASPCVVPRRLRMHRRDHEHHGEAGPAGERRRRTVRSRRRCTPRDDTPRRRRPARRAPRRATSPWIVIDRTPASAAAVRERTRASPRPDRPRPPARRAAPATWRLDPHRTRRRAPNHRSSGSTVRATSAASTERSSVSSTAKVAVSCAYGERGA